MGLEKLDWLSNEGISGWLGELVEEHKETNKILMELVISIKAFLIGKTLQKEDEVEKSVSEGSGASGIINKDASFTDSKALVPEGTLPVVREVISTPKEPAVRKEPLKVDEKIYMDTEQVLPFHETEKALLIVKNGLQTWVIKSGIKNKYEMQTMLNLELSDWAAEKLNWVPFKPRNGGS